MGPWIVLLMFFVKRSLIIIQERCNFVITSGVLPTVFDWGISSAFYKKSHFVTAGHLLLPSSRTDRFRFNGGVSRFLKPPWK